MSIFVGLTKFDRTDDLQEHIPNGESTTIFSDFIQIMHALMRAERLKYTSCSALDVARIEDITFQIKTAKSRMIQLGQRIEFRSPEARRDFEYLVYMYYHATLIYSRRVLADNPFEECIRSSQHAILEYVLHLSRSAAVAHDLVWPLFIAGAECRGIPHMQQIVEMQISGSLDRNRVLSFLRTFWTLRPEIQNHVDWKCASEVHPFWLPDNCLRAGCYLVSI